MLTNILVIIGFLTVLNWTWKLFWRWFSKTKFYDERRQKNSQEGLHDVIQGAKEFYSGQ